MVTRSSSRTATRSSWGGSTFRPALGAPSWPWGDMRCCSATGRFAWVQQRQCTSGGRLVYVRVPTCPPRGTSNIRHLTDVSHCNLHQHLCCNREINYLGRLDPSPGLAGQSEKRSAGPLAQPGKEPDEYHGADPPSHAAPTNTSDRPHRPERAAEAAAPNVLQKRRVAGRGTGIGGRSRSQVKATIQAWEIPVTRPSRCCSPANW